MRTGALVLLCLCAAAARAQNDANLNTARSETASQDIDQSQAQQQAVALLKSRIQEDPSVATAVASRIERSSFGPKITQSMDADTRLQQVQDWVTKDPDTAALMAVGLLGDDATGTHDFETAANQSVDNSAHFEFNPNSKKNLYGRLKKSGLDSKLFNKQGAGMAPEEQRELLRTMFEGQGGQSGKIITQELEGNGGNTAHGGVVGQGGFDNSYFNRLSGGNLHGYSPQLQALQSSLNRRRVPGAPPLIETGMLDYQTLSYPSYGMKYDISNLEQRLRLEQNFFLAKALGIEKQFTADQLLDPSVEAKLKSQAAAKGIKLPDRFNQRELAIERAAAAVKTFDSAALPARDPMRISKGLLQSLGSKQKEAARWITAASLEEELERLDQQASFMSAELIMAIDHAPVEEGTRTSYKRRGEDYKKKLDTIKANDAAAITRLESDSWLSQVDSIETSLDSNVDLRRNLVRNIQDFVNTPFRLDALYSNKPRWRQWVDDCVKAYLPTIAYSRDLIATDRQRGLLKDIFSKIASGDLDAAHTILASYEPGRPATSR
jgi:hypothetical protein